MNVRGTSLAPVAAQVWWLIDQRIDFGCASHVMMYKNPKID